MKKKKEDNSEQLNDNCAQYYFIGFKVHIV